VRCLFGVRFLGGSFEELEHVWSTVNRGTALIDPAGSQVFRDLDCRVERDRHLHGHDSCPVPVGTHAHLFLMSPEKFVTGVKASTTAGLRGLGSLPQT
jgi:hypothetical protein